jgi:O-antigen/teichoic acid export membrane protein
VRGDDPRKTTPLHLDACPTVPIVRRGGRRWDGYALAGLRTEPFTVPVMAPQGPCTQPRGGLGEGVALSISSALGALAGLASWLIAARLLPQAELGLGAAVVSAFFLVAGVVRLNLGVALMRWLPVAGRHAPRLVRRSLSLIVVVATIGGLVCVFVLPELARTSAGDGPLALGMALFVVTTAGWAVLVVHDYVFVAIGKPWWTVWRNGLFAIGRIGLLVALGSALGARGVVLSWAGPIVALVVVDVLLLALSVRRFAAQGGAGTMPARSEVVSFLAPTWVAQIGNTLLLNQVPLLVTLRFGPESGAAFFIAWQAAVVLETAATYFTHSLPAACARAPERADELTSSLRRQMLMIFLPLLALGALLAGPVLSIFGAGYAAAADVLRLLLLGQAFRLLVLHELGARTATGCGLAYARLHLASTLLVLLVVGLVPASAGGTVSAALLPVVWGYVAVQLACAVHVILVRSLAPARPRRPAPS